MVIILHLQQQQQ